MATKFIVDNICPIGLVLKQLHCVAPLRTCPNFLGEHSCRIVFQQKCIIGVLETGNVIQGIRKCLLALSCYHIHGVGRSCLCHCRKILHSLDGLIFFGQRNRRISENNIGNLLLAVLHHNYPASNSLVTKRQVSLALISNEDNMAFDGHTK